MKRIETVGSIFEIDEDLMRYRRWPKQEAPRDNPEWSDSRAGALQDFVWHSYERWETDFAHLRIYYLVDGNRQMYLQAPLPWY